MKSLYKCSECNLYFEHKKINELHDELYKIGNPKMVCNDCFKKLTKQQKTINVKMTIRGPDERPYGLEV